MLTLSLEMFIIIIIIFIIIMITIIIIQKRTPAYWLYISSRYSVPLCIPAYVHTCSKDIRQLFTSHV